ncbi:hypothetical protein FLA105534_02050 [Flavobacterium bizetiae]|uniref:Helix-turn-helix domain-containing protein n=1 Tax=Flavobacterium bizetiae TaxID=2704140 RepID=A0A6J4GJ33_9FLAO|nr:DNA-binding protein [Flavobacterium bizetiae]CAA9198274.1 hypothetical protein FLA105534_02050 [Flavobacterium bizetiae]CAD5343545.1 hypothetical protein FLA105535_03544 [Flavobacterium bizetiae]CAD5349539.1 hypothetical protein FLA105534_03524 [Flavobacterium bizetiae]
MKETNEIITPIIKLLEELKSKMETIETPKRFYRNKHLKMHYGLSDNTIISYRDNNILPFTKLGEIYFYPVDKIDEILNNNSNFSLLKRI